MNRPLPKLQEASRIRLWLAIVLTLAAGVMTGAQLGKIAPLIGWYRDDVGMSLVASGWLAALLGVFIAVGAMPAGWLVERVGLVRSILVGSLALGIGAGALALAEAPVAIYAARLLEAAGYLSLCIALPAILAQVSPPDWRGAVLAVWSGFVPLGYAVSDFLAGWMLPAMAERSYLAAVALIFCAVAAAAICAMRGLAPAGSGESGARLTDTLSLPVLLLAFSFGMFVVLSVSMFTFMPSFVAGAGSHYLVSAGAVALSVPLGNFVAAILVRGRGARFMAALAVAGFAIGIAAAVPAFALQDPLAATLSAFVLAVSGALVASAQFAVIPHIVSTRGSVAVAIGLVAQAGGLGTLFGPPLAAIVIEGLGWPAFGGFLALAAGLGLLAMLPLLRQAPAIEAA